MHSLKYLILFFFFFFILFATQKPVDAVRYDVYDLTPEGSRFTNEMGVVFAHRCLETASEYVLKFFGNTRKSYVNVSVIVQPLGSPYSYVAKTYNNTIAINSDYIQYYPRDLDVKYEFCGIMYNECTHVWQWTGNGQAPEGLITGIADYVRLKAGWPNYQWLNQSRGSGYSWDTGSLVTAYFLEYCSDLRPGFVSELNGLMKDHYSDDFFVQLLGRPANDLWLAYKTSYAPISEAPAPTPSGL